MLQVLSIALLWFSAIGCAVIGGVYFAFSTFVMTALGSLERSSGMEAMQAVNQVILRSLFMPLFFATTLASAALAVLAVTQWSLPQSRWMLAGSVLFVAGMFLVTVACNVPLNKALASVRAAEPGLEAVWAGYLATWTLWNHVRTAASIAASAIYIFVLARG